MNTLPDRKTRKLAAYKKGRRGELLARWYLRFKGFRIIRSRYKTKLGEIDIIARKKDLVIFVEVKARQSANAAMDAVSHEAQGRIRNAADIWLSGQKDAHVISMRFDVIAVVPGKLPTHLEDAF